MSKVHSTSPLAIVRVLEHEMRHENRLDSNQLLSVLRTVVSLDVCSAGTEQRAQQLMADIGRIMQRSTESNPEDTTWFNAEALTKHLPLLVERALHQSSMPVFDHSKDASVVVHESEDFGVQLYFPVQTRFKLPLLYSWLEQDSQSLLSLSYTVPVAMLNKRLHFLYALAEQDANLQVQIHVWRLQQSLWCTLTHTVGCGDYRTEIVSGMETRSFPCHGLERCLQRLTEKLL